MKVALLVTALVAVTLSAVAPPVWPSQVRRSSNLLFYFSFLCLLKNNSHSNLRIVLR